MVVEEFNQSEEVSPTRDEALTNGSIKAVTDARHSTSKTLATLRIRLLSVGTDGGGYITFMYQ